MYKDACYSIYYSKNWKQYDNILEDYKVTHSSTTCINIIKTQKNLLIGKKKKLAEGYI